MTIDNFDSNSEIIYSFQTTLVFGNKQIIIVAVEFIYKNGNQ